MFCPSGTGNSTIISVGDKKDLGMLTVYEDYSGLQVYSSLRGEKLLQHFSILHNNKVYVRCYS